MSRCDPKQLRQVSGEAAFGRGAEYAASGAANIGAADAGGIHALVHGADLYRVRLHGQGGDFAGFCNCPACERDGWCKHLVAVALVANAAGEAVPNRRGAIRSHLIGLGNRPLPPQTARSPGADRHRTS